VQLVLHVRFVILVLGEEWLAVIGTLATTAEAGGERHDD